MVKGRIWKYIIKLLVISTDPFLRLVLSFPVGLETKTISRVANNGQTPIITQVTSMRTKRTCVKVD